MSRKTHSRGRATRRAGRQRVGASMAISGAVVAALSLGGLSVGAGRAAAAGPGDPPIKAGGSMTVLLPGSTEAAWPQGLDPGTDGNGGSNEDLEGAIFGSLFELGPNGVTVPDLASGYKISNGGKTYTIDIRKGVTFSDGTPFNAAAVVYNWNRDFKLDTANTPNWPSPTFSVAGPETAVINLKTAYSPLLNSMHTRNVNFIASPTAIQKMGTKAFALKPVGAGPFEVVSDTLSTELSLRRNPTYWQKGLPYLDDLTFKAAAADGTAIEAMQAGQVQAYKDMTTPQLVKSASTSFTVTAENTGSPQDVQMNMKKAPFDNKLAREALYYAVDDPTLDKTLFGDITPPVQGFTGPGGLFYQPKVPGYRTYDLAKAKAIVKQLGGLSFSMLAGQTETAKTLAEGLQTMWQAAGMKVSLSFVDTPTVVNEFDSGNWQADLSADGAFDPATGVAQMFRFLSTSPFSGIHDPKLDTLLNKATEVPEAQRGAVYRQVAKYESDQAYVVQLFPSFVWNVTDKDVYAPGLTTVLPATEIVPEVWWQDAGYRK